MDIHDVRPGMICYTSESSGYVLEVDIQSQLVLLQNDQAIPFQVHVSELTDEPQPFDKPQ
ncbi:MAG: hypothetical protein ACTHY5_07250 [Oceanisphaera sp.]|uniref:hypothetical protein n=1 Tax=Oceanisphaera sp. TaxID=1929979 RepID=UPI003F967C41